MTAQQHRPFVAVGIVTFLLLLPLTGAVADSLTGKVVKITDGDTVYVLDANYQEHKIRLAGVDAPERKQAYGLASRKHLASMVAGKQVTVEYEKRDRYGRIVGKVLLDGIDACLESPGITKNTNTNKVWKTNGFTPRPKSRPAMKD